MRTHGMKYTKEYNTWAQMKQRCLNPNHFAYTEYGGRGISINPSWVESFESFYSDMGAIPTLGGRHSLERLDNNKGYSPENCIWASYKKQARNMRKKGNNTSGVNGVCLRNAEGLPTHWRADWLDIEGKRVTKQFSIKNYGYKFAFGLACACRDRVIDELNKQLKHRYSLNHGK